MSTTVIPEPIAQLRRQLAHLPRPQPRGKKLPDSVWQAAVELARGLDAVELSRDDGTDRVPRRFRVEL